MTLGFGTLETNGKFDPSKTVTSANIAPYISTIVSIWTDGDETSGTLSGNYYTFTGRRSDPESELYYFRNRYYSGSLGRFVTRDPHGRLLLPGRMELPPDAPYWAGMSLYGGHFVPNYVDYDGLQRRDREPPEDDSGYLPIPFPDFFRDIPDWALEACTNFRVKIGNTFYRTIPCPGQRERLRRPRLCCKITTPIRLRMTCNCLDISVAVHVDILFAPNRIEDRACSKDNVPALPPDLRDNLPAPGPDRET